MRCDGAVSLAFVYPALLGTYGDAGNVLVLQRRLEWRGIGVEVVPVAEGETVPAGCDLYVLGGAEDGAGRRAAALLGGQRGFRRAVLDGTPVFAVCAGMQLLGDRVDTGAGAHAGLGLLDLTTVEGDVRAVGEVVVSSELPGTDDVLTGFENHRGATMLGPTARPLGTVVSGVGNAGGYPVEGVVQGRVVGTYLHGPVLARNPGLADLLLSWATGRALAPLDVPSVRAARAERSGADGVRTA